MEALGLRIGSRRSAHEDFGPPAGDDETPIPATVLLLLRRTRWLYRVWWTTHYTIGLLGVIAGTLLTALTSAPADAGGSLAGVRDYAWLIGIVAAVATSLVTFLGPLHKAERYWSAYHLLEQACLEYRGNEGDPKLRRLMKRVMAVRRILQVADADEKIVGDVKNSMDGPVTGLGT